MNFADFFGKSRSLYICIDIFLKNEVCSLEKNDGDFFLKKMIYIKK